MTYVTDRLLLMVILCGQPEMAKRIVRFKALRSRMIPASIEPLSQKEAQKMMEFRWDVAVQNKNNPLPFSKKAIDELYRNGNPRSICQAADISLLAAFNMKKKKIDERIAKMVTRSLLTEVERK